MASLRCGCEYTMQICCGLCNCCGECCEYPKDAKAFLGAVASTIDRLDKEGAASPEMVQKFNESLLLFDPKRANLLPMPEEKPKALPPAGVLHGKDWI